MGELREIVDIATVERLFLLLAIVAPIVGLIIGAVLGGRSGNRKRALTLGMAAGLLGPLNWLLWCVYNAITERNGLDTVKNLFINLALFAALGVVVGLVAGRLFRPQPEQPLEPSPEPEA